MALVLGVLAGLGISLAASSCKEKVSESGPSPPLEKKRAEEKPQLQPIELPLAWEFDYKNEVKDDAEFSDITEDGKYIVGWYGEPDRYADNRRDFLWRYSVLDKKLDTLDLSRLGIHVRDYSGYPQVDIHPDGRYALVYSGRYKLSQVDFAQKKLTWTRGIGGYVSDALWSEKYQLWIVSDTNGDLTVVELHGNVRYHKRLHWRFDRLMWGPNRDSVVAIPFRTGGPYVFDLLSENVVGHGTLLSVDWGERSLATRSTDRFLLSAYIYQAFGSAAILYTVGEEGNLRDVVAWETWQAPIVGLAPSGYVILGSFLFVPPYSAETTTGDDLEKWIYTTAMSQWKPRRLNYPFDFNYQEIPKSYEVRVVDEKGSTVWYQDLVLPHPDGPLFGPGAWDLESLTDSRKDPVTIPFLVGYEWVEEKNGYVQTYYEVGETGLSEPKVSVWLPAREKAYDEEEPPYPAYGYRYVDSGRIRLLHKSGWDEGKLIAYRMPEILFREQD